MDELEQRAESSEEYSSSRARALAGWHSFRRGLATVLFDLGVDPEVAATILRHSDSRTTRRHYIKLQSQKKGAAAMQRLENALAKKARTRPRTNAPSSRARWKPHKHWQKNGADDQT